ncbi:carboxypeptidase-like regulatory domain-containing protein [Rossellomorea sp. BNER]|nr:carboxypeptidase-like regulatory domain-containing protein [Rossellomorea sp. BNER]
MVVSTLSDQRGNYILTNLPPGNYYVIFSAEGYVRSTIPVTLSPDETEIVNMALEPNPGTISGNVRLKIRWNPFKMP